MCGIAGYFNKTGVEQPVGQLLLRMLGALARRGPDSAGLAHFGAGTPEGEVCWIKLSEHEPANTGEAGVLDALGTVAEVRGHERVGGLIRAVIRRRSEVRELCDAVERTGPDVEVVSLGERLELVKQVGAPGNLDATFHIGGFHGSHGIGHTRLSTESIVDLSHSQPFWARGVADLAIVHNGHITNYDKLRRIYEQRGIRFFTHNDSEVIAVYLADELAKGRTLDEAMRSSLDDLDGSFTYLAATPDQLGYARDPFCFKPLIIVETESYVALANEEVAIRAALSSEGVAYETSGHEYRLWQRAGAMVGAAS